MIQYNIGCSTWGYPIVWQRSTPNGVWVGAAEHDPDRLDPALICNLPMWEFAKRLKHTVRTGGWIHSIHHHIGWFQVSQVDPWCIFYKSWCGREVVPFIHINAYADESKDNVIFSDYVPMPDRLVWNLHGFVAG